MLKTLLIIVVLVLIGVVIPFTPAMPPDEYVTIPTSVPEDLAYPIMGWGRSRNAQSGLVSSVEMAWLPGWSQDQYLNVEEPSVTYKWVKDDVVVYEYKLLPGKCVKINEFSVQFEHKQEGEFSVDIVSECSWW